MKRLPILLLLCASLLSAQEEPLVDEFPIWGWTGSYGADATINFRIEGNRLRVYMLDAEMQPFDSGIERINARINPRGDAPFFLPLNFDAAKLFFTHPRFIGKPHIFQVTLFLIDDDGEAERSYSFFLSQTGKNTEPKS